MKLLLICVLAIALSSANNLKIAIKEVHQNSVKGSIYIVDNDDTVVDISNVQIYLYLNPSGTIESSNWNININHGSCLFSISLWCKGEYKIIAASPGYTDTISELVNITYDDCYPTYAVASATTSKQLFRVDMETHWGYGGDLMGYTSYTLKEISGAQVSGITTLKNTDGKTFFYITFNEIGLKRLISSCNNYYTIYFEINVLGLDNKYLKIEKSGGKEFYLKQSVDAVVKVYNDPEMTNLDTGNEFFIEILFNCEGSIEGVVNGTITSGVLEFPNLKLLNKGNFMLMAKSDNVKPGYSEEFHVDELSLAIQIVTKYPNKTNDIFSIQVTVYYGMFKYNQTSLLVKLNDVITGNLTNYTVNGVATFNNLTFKLPGIFTIIATTEEFTGYLGNLNISPWLQIATPSIIDTISPFNISIDWFLDQNLTLRPPTLNFSFYIYIIPDEIYIGKYTQITGESLIITGLIISNPGTFNVFIKYNNQFTPSLPINSYLYAEEMIPTKKIHNYESEINVPIILYINVYRDNQSYAFYKDKSVKIFLFIEKENEFLLLGCENTIMGMATFKNLTLTRLGETKFKVMGDQIFERVFKLNAKGYMKIVPLTEYPSNTDESFSIEAILYQDSKLTIPLMFPSCDLTLLIVHFANITNGICKITNEGVAKITDIYILSQGTYEISFFSNFAINLVLSKIFNVIYSQSVIKMTVNNNNFVVKKGEKINLHVELYGFDLKLYKNPASVFIKSLANINSDIITFKNTTIGIVDFILPSDNFDKALLQIVTNVSSPLLLPLTIEINTFDIICGGLDNNLKCSSCVNGAELGDFGCECKKNRSFNNLTGECSCNEGFINNNGNCTECMNYIEENDISATFSDDYQNIFIDISVPIKDYLSYNCLLLISYSENIRQNIESCFFMSNMRIYVKGLTFLSPFNSSVTFNYKMISDAKSCILMPENYQIKILMKNPFPQPQVQIIIPNIISIPCLVDGIIISTKFKNLDYDYDWSIKEIYTNALLIEEPINNNADVIIGNNQLIEGIYNVSLIVTSKAFFNSAMQWILMNVTNTQFLTVSFNVGNNVKIKANENFNIYAIASNTCKTQGTIIYTWKYISDYPLNFSTILQNSPTENSLVIPKYTLKQGQTYNFEVTASLNNDQSLDGKNIISIQVISENLSLKLSRSGGTIGIDEDFSVTATAYDPNDLLYSVNINWVCIENSSPCLDSYGNFLIQNASNPSLIIKRYYLKDKAHYQITCTASSLSGNITSILDIKVDAKAKGAVHLEYPSSIIDNSSPIILIPDLIIPNFPSFEWSISPELLGNKSISLFDSFLKFDPTDLIPGITHTITFNMTGGLASSITTSIDIKRNELPKCDTFHKENSGNKWQIITRNCFSVNGEITYQYGLSDTNQIVFWKTKKIYKDKITIFKQENVTLFLLNVCDDYGCNLYYASNSEFIRMVEEKKDDEIKYDDYDDIPDTIIYYAQNADKRQLKELVKLFINFFANETSDEATFGVFLTCLLSITSKADLLTKKDLSNIISLTMDIVKSYPYPITSTQMDNLINTFSKIVSEYPTEDLIESLKTLSIISAHNALPDEEYLYESLMTLFYHRTKPLNYNLFPKTLTYNFFSTANNNFELTIFYGNYIHPSSIVDIHFFKYIKDDIIFHISIYVSGSYDSCVIKNIPLIPVDISDLLFISLKIYHESITQLDIYKCKSFDDNSEHTENDCQIVEINAGSIKVLLSKGSQFKLIKIGTIGTGNQVFVTIGTILSIGLPLICALWLRDKNSDEVLTPHKYILVYTIISLFVRQRPLLRAFTIFQLSTVALMILSLIGVMEYLFNLTEAQESHGHFALLSGFIAFCLLQFVNLPLSYVRITAFESKGWRIVAIVVCFFASGASIITCWVINKYTTVRFKERCLYTFIVFYAIEVFAFQGILSLATRMSGKDNRMQKVRQEESYGGISLAQ
ncbi:hypothetical protein SteCoe_11522 [Stentor coeruleus]|uniref:PKD/REJ-like domain-containing protein n=1 Tax=Stentor coeruleus TaxID=5963 RepID=A0A1R2CD28_9CILI|nr:hypothetical protein SteCoe_11522 [Stentor coeruleus]